MKSEEPLSLPWAGEGVPAAQAARVPARRFPLVHVLLFATTARV